jgi:hypothetical protein
MAYVENKRATSRTGQGKSMKNEELLKELIELTRKVNFLIEEVNTVKDRLENIEPIKKYLKKKKS